MAINKVESTNCILELLENERTVGAGRPTDLHLNLAHDLGLSATAIEELAAPISDWIHQQGLDILTISRHSLSDATTIKDLIDTIWKKIQKAYLTDFILELLKNRRSKEPGIKPTDIHLYLGFHLGLTGTGIEALAHPITVWLRGQGYNVTISRTDFRNASTIKDLIDIAWEKANA